MEAPGCGRELPDASWPDPAAGPVRENPLMEGSTMSRSVNKIILVGHVGRDPEVRQTQAGTKVANFSLATNYRTGGDDPQERTDWHRLTLWTRLAQFAEEYVRKGDRVYVEGRLAYDSYEREGVTIPTAEVHVRELVLLSPPRETSNGEEVAEAAEAAV
jgi:single-strand DNA-binding protein